MNDCLWVPIFLLRCSGRVIERRGEVIHDRTHFDRRLGTCRENCIYLSRIEPIRFEQLSKLAGAKFLTCHELSGQRDTHPSHRRGQNIRRGVDPQLCGDIDASCGLMKRKTPTLATEQTMLNSAIVPREFSRVVITTPIQRHEWTAKEW